jgi:hypothetical protein
VPELCEKVEAKTVLNTARTSATLSSVALCDVGLDKATELPFLVEPAVGRLTRSPVCSLH